LADCYVNEDLNFEFGSPQVAIDAGVKDASDEQRRQLLAEWNDWIRSDKLTGDIRGALNDDLGFNVLFKDVDEAQQLMDHLQQQLLANLKP
jgi:hypothetical protein